MSLAKDLFEAVYYGTDMEFCYNGLYYSINSGSEARDGKVCHEITLHKSSYPYIYGIHGNDDFSEVIYEAKNPDKSENTQMFFDAPLFDGKSLWDIVDELGDIEY